LGFRHLLHLTGESQTRRAVEIAGLIKDQRAMGKRAILAGEVIDPAPSTIGHRCEPERIAPLGNSFVARFIQHNVGFDTQSARQGCYRLPYKTETAGSVVEEEQAASNRKAKREVEQGIATS